jgi:hypothetical protein
MAELRRDPLVQRWVIISDKRGKRPSDFKRTPSSKEEEVKQGPCAFCPGFEEGTGPETFAVREGGEPNASDWRVRVIVNKFPAVSQDFPCGSVVGEGTVFGECRLPAFGSHEVVIETPSHDTPFVDLPVSHICDVLKAYQERMKFFRKDSRFKFCQVKKKTKICTCFFLSFFRDVSLFFQVSCLLHVFMVAWWCHDVAWLFYIIFFGCWCHVWVCILFRCLRTGVIGQEHQ